MRGLGLCFVEAGRMALLSHVRHTARGTSNPGGFLRTAGRFFEWFDASTSTESQARRRPRRPAQKRALESANPPPRPPATAYRFFLHYAHFP